MIAISPQSSNHTFLGRKLEYQVPYYFDTQCKSPFFSKYFYVEPFFDTHYSLWIPIIGCVHPTPIAYCISVSVMGSMEHVCWENLCWFCYFALSLPISVGICILYTYFGLQNVASRF